MQTARHRFPPNHPHPSAHILVHEPSPAQCQTDRPRESASHQIVHIVQLPLRFASFRPPFSSEQNHCPPSAIAAQASVFTTQSSPAPDRQTANPSPPTKLSAHKRPVDRPVGLRVCRCRYRRRPLADVPKERAAIQLPESKRPFPERRAAWGWLPAAAFYPANPQPEASAGFLVPFSKKGTSF